MLTPASTKKAKRLSIETTRVKRDRVEFVVPHHGVPVAVLDGRSRDLNGFGVLRTSVDKVAHEET